MKITENAACKGKFFYWGQKIV